MSRWLYAALLLVPASHALADGNQSLPEVDSEWDAVFMLAPPDNATSSDEKATHGKKKHASKKETAAGYAKLRDSWHAPVEDGSWGTVEDGAPRLILKSAHAAEEPAVLTPASEEGGFDEGDVAMASSVMGGWAGGPSAHPRLLDLLYQAAQHFDVHTITVVSGIRHDRSGSRHSHGLAADIVLPGVKDEALAAFFRPMGFVGVGTYPKAGFVHIDVRERSYFWVDKSAPGSKRSRQTQVRADEAKAADEAAIARGEHPNDNPEKLRKALAARGSRRHKAREAKEGRERESGKSRHKDKDKDDDATQVVKHHKHEPSGTRSDLASTTNKPTAARPALPGAHDIIPTSGGFPDDLGALPQ